MDLLENALVRKYFGECIDHAVCGQNCMSYHVLQAMQTPIKAGERYLGWPGYQTTSQWTEQVYAGHEMAPGAVDFHPYQLRLPQKFQKKECIHCFCRTQA